MPSHLAPKTQIPACEFMVCLDCQILAERWQQMLQVRNERVVEGQQQSASMVGRGSISQIQRSQDRKCRFPAAGRTKHCGMTSGRQIEHLPLPPFWRGQGHTTSLSCKNRNRQSVTLKGPHSRIESSLSPSSRNAVFVSSTACLDTPPSGATSTETVNLRFLLVAKRDKTFV